MTQDEKAALADLAYLLEMHEKFCKQYSVDPQSLTIPIGMVRILARMKEN